MANMFTNKNAYGMLHLTQIIMQKQSQI